MLQACAGLASSAHQASSSASAEAADRDVDDGEEEDEPETLPLLARRVMAGRQSIIPQPAKVLPKLQCQSCTSSFPLQGM